MKKRMFKITALILSAVLLVTGTFYFTLAYLQAKSNPVVNTFTAGKINLTLKESEVDEYGNIKYYTAESFENGVLTDTPEFSLVEGPVGEGAGAKTYDTVNLVEENNYKLVPGETYTKNPVVTVKKESEPCFLYLAVHNGLNGNLNDGINDLNIEATSDGVYKTVAEQLSANGWLPLQDIPKEGEEQWKATWPQGPTSRNFTIYYRYFKDDSNYIVNALETGVEFKTFDQFKVDTLATSEQIAFLQTCYDSNGEVELNEDIFADETTGNILLNQSVSTIEVYALAVQSAGFANTYEGIKSAWQVAFGA